MERFNLKKSQIMWQSKKSIRLKFQIGFQLWKTDDHDDDDVDINRA